MAPPLKRCAARWRLMYRRNRLGPFLWQPTCPDASASPPGCRSGGLSAQFENGAGAASTSLSALRRQRYTFAFSLLLMRLLMIVLEQRQMGTESETGPRVIPSGDHCSCTLSCCIRTTLITPLQWFHKPGAEKLFLLWVLQHLQRKRRF